MTSGRISRNHTYDFYNKRQKTFETFEIYRGTMTIFKGERRWKKYTVRFAKYVGGQMIEFS